jgi:DNA-binding CsgD family transcriptional regulator
MIKINPMNLETRIAVKIATAELTFDLLPCVVIIHDLHKQSVVYMSKRGRDILGVTNEELQEMGFDYFPKFFNMEEAKEYVPKILGLLERNNDDETVNYYQQVRRPETEEWQWYMSSTRIFFRDDENKPILTITVSIPVDETHSLTMKVDRLMKENTFLRENKHLFAKLTQREIEVLKRIAKGMSSQEIAEELFIAEDTIKTHRRNIKRKIQVNNQYDLVLFAQSFDLLV